MTYYGNILQVDLGRGKHTSVPLSDDTLHTSIGGRGYNVHYLFDHLGTGIDPLEPDNILLFTCGLLTGTKAPASSRLHINALSPLTGLMGSSNIGGHMGAWLRSNDIQSIIVRGRSPQPVYIYIAGGKVEIRDAHFLKDLDTIESQDRIKQELRDPHLKCLVIGPAGENLARFACIISGHDHAAGRTGMGTVMGSKNLKAIVVARRRKKQKREPSPGSKNAVKQYVEKIKASPDYKTFSRYGGAGYVKWADDMGIMGTRNYRESRFGDIDKIDGRRLEPYKVKSMGCYNCPVQCKAVLNFKKQMGSQEMAYRPEFEPMINIGAKCGLDDLKAIVLLDNLCTRLGLDSTSAATAMAFAMDLFERNLLTSKETGNLILSWGNAPVMETLLKQMARAEGFGAVLSQGVRKAAQIIGKDAERYAAHEKGLELTAYHPGSIMGTALGYAVSSRGGDYNNIYASLEYRWSKDKATREFGDQDSVDIHTPHGKGKLIRRAVLVNIVLDSLGVCKVPALSMLGTFDLKNEATLAGALMDTPITPEQLFAVSERIATMERLFNFRQTPGMLKDGLPAMFLDQPGSNLNPATLDYMLQDYYAAMGWDDKGRPKPETLNKYLIKE
jgi:aldehyde:ferredoxin oxidoreductase